MRGNPDNLKAEDLHAACLEVIDREEKQANIVAGSAVVGIGLTLIVGIAGILIGAKKR